MNVVAYARFSSHNQTEKSIEAQVREISAYASVSGYNLIKVYADNARSGYSADRPEFQKMIQDSNTGMFNAVLVHKYDRFGRDADDAAYYERQLRKNGVLLISVEEKLDTSTPEGVLLKRMIQSINEFYGKNLAREVMKGMKTNALKALHNGGTPALGYDVAHDKTYRIVESEAVIVRVIFSMYADGYSYPEIISLLNANNWKTKAGRPFGKNSLHDILKNERYAGVYTFNKAAARSPVDRSRNMHKYKDANNIIRIDGGVPAIIDKLTFERVQKRMEQNRKMAGRNKSKREYLLSGKVYCGLCGCSMTGETRTTRSSEYGYYICNHKSRQPGKCEMRAVPQVKLEETVIERLNQSIFSKENIRSICENIYISMNESGRNDDEISKLKHEVAMLDKKISNGAKAILDGLKSPEFRKIVEDLSEQRRDIQMRLIELDSIPAEKKSLEDIIAEYSEYSDIGKLPFIQRRAVIEKFIHKILVFPQPDKGWHIRIIISSENPAKELSDYLDLVGSAPPAPLESKTEISFTHGILVLDFCLLPR